MPQDILHRKYNVRFTPDEIEELVNDTQNPLTAEEIAKMHPQDQLLVDFYRRATVPGLGAAGMGAMGLVGKGMEAVEGAAKAAPGLVNKAKAAWDHVAPLAGGAIGTGLGALVGHPLVGGMIGTKIGGKALFGPPRAPVEPVKPPVRRVTGPFSDRPSQFSTVREQVQRGVQNDFEGPMGQPIKLKPGGNNAPRPGAAYSDNVNTQSSTDELTELLTGSSHPKGGDPTPIRYHDDKEGLRKSVDNLKRKTESKPKPKRRSPK